MDWIFYPRTITLPDFLCNTNEVFRKNYSKINSLENDHCNETRLNSDAVLKILEKELQQLGYAVETSKRKDDKIRISVLFGDSGSEELSFEADAYSKEHKTVIEVEAGRAVVNYQFLKDLFQASMMVDTDYLVLAVRKPYRSKNDYESVKKFLDMIFYTRKVQLDLKGILLIGY